MQYLSMFGKIMKIDEDFGIEVYILSCPYRMPGLLFAREVQAKGLMRLVHSRIWKTNA